MTGRPHKERLRSDLTEIRKELTEEVQRLKPEEMDWAPAPEMKTFRALLAEIGAMEKICVHWLAHQAIADWGEIDSDLRRAADNPQTILSALGEVRWETLDALNACSEERLQTAVPVPEEWRQYWGAAVEPEEVFRWVARHEYYHLGQIIIYRWQRGDNPYKRGAN
jgi:hypothetical protein